MMCRLPYLHQPLKDCCVPLQLCFDAVDLTLCCDCMKWEITRLHREQRNLPVGHGSKHHRSHQQAKHVDRWSETVQSSFVTHQVPLEGEKMRIQWAWTTNLLIFVLAAGKSKLESLLSLCPGSLTQSTVLRQLALRVKQLAWLCLEQNLPNHQTCYLFLVLFAPIFPLTSTNYPETGSAGSSVKELHCHIVLLTDRSDPNM